MTLRRQRQSKGFVRTVLVLVVLLPLLPPTVRAETANDRNVLRRHRDALFEVVPLPGVGGRAKVQPTIPPRMKTKRTKTPHPKQNGHVGTKLDWRRPTPERVARWFSGTPTTTKGRSMTTSHDNAFLRLFNHNAVGMTNPMLGVSTAPAGTASIDSRSSSSDASTNTKVSLVSTRPPQRPEDIVVEDTWIPASSSSAASVNDPMELAVNSPTAGWSRVIRYRWNAPNRLDDNNEAANAAWWPGTRTCSNNNNIQKNPDGWRVMRLRRRVGRGLECYEQVRDAALAWNFGRHEQGIVAVPSTVSHKTNYQQDDWALNDQVAQHVQPIWSGPHASRRLVTFTACGFRSRWLPKLYALNPVMVIYELPDQRGPGTTYTSTAYATMAGHLIRGEERVTVALRDDTGNVDVEILSYSRPGPSFKGRMAWPLLGKMQLQFFDNQLDHFSQTANSAAQGTTPPVSTLIGSTTMAK